jgi:CrcB protein
VKAALGIAFAGALGAMSRHLVGTWVTARFSGSGPVPGLPWGTVAVNVTGSFLLGFVGGLALTGDRVPAAWRPALTTGFLGSFTTFSTFSVETIRLLEQGEWATALANVSVQLALGMGAAVGGLAAGRALG